MSEPTDRQLVLVGAGHAHLHVVREWARRRLQGVSVTLITPEPAQMYSGMVPGYLRGQYEADALLIDVARVARCSGVRLVLGHAERVSATECRVVVGGRSVAFDLCSIDVGGAAAGGHLPGVADHALSLRPMSGAVEVRARLDALLTGHSPVTVCVVGAGAGGVEVSLALRQRIRASAVGGTVMLVDGAESVLAAEPGATSARVAALLAKAGVGTALGSPVARVHAGGVTLRSGATVPADLVVWVSGAAPPGLLASSDLARDTEGFLLVDQSLRVANCTAVWGAGDCVSVRNQTAPQRSGAAAVRQGPVLLRNLRAALGAGRPGRYRARRRTLSLMDTADGQALLRWGGVAFASRPVLALKRWIDERWVNGFRVRCDEKPVPTGLCS